MWGIDIGRELAPGHHAAGLFERSAHTETWLAWSTRLQRLVRVRVPRRCPVTRPAIDELHREFTTLAGFEHWGLGSALQTDLTGELPYAVYDHIPGPSLASSIGCSLDALGLDNVLRLGNDLACTLGYIHGEGYCHLDLRPHVIADAPDGAVILDARMALPIGKTLVRFYSPERLLFTSPEQVRGEPGTTAMDMFALGSVLYQAAVGVLVETAGSRHRPSFRTTSSGRTRLRPLAEVAPGLPTEFVTLVEDLMTNDPKARPTTDQATARMQSLLLPGPRTPGAESNDEIWTV